MLHNQSARQCRANAVRPAHAGDIHRTALNSERRGGQKR